MKEIGDKIRFLRNAKKLTQEEAAFKVGMTRQSISNYECGRRTPRIKDLQKIANFYGVGIEYFGVDAIDEVFDLLARAKDVFTNNHIPTEQKEKLYREFMRLYLSIKDDRNEEEY